MPNPVVVTHLYDGSTLSFDVPFPYLKNEHVSITVGGEPAAYEWINPSRFRLLTAPPIGTAIVIERITETSPLYTIPDNRPVPSDWYNKLTRQAIYLAEEGKAASVVSGEQANQAAQAALESAGVAMAAANLSKPFASRDVFLSTPIVVDVAAVRSVAGGVVCDFIRDPAGPIMGVDGGRWRPAGSPTPQHFGAIGDGVTDDTAAMQAWSAYVDQMRQTGPVCAVATGKYRMSHPLVFTSNGGFRSSLILDGAEFICDFNRDEYPYFLFFGNPANLAQYQSVLDIKGRFFLRKGPNCTRPPVGIQFYGIAQSTLSGLNTGPWENTVVHYHGPQNITIYDPLLYYGGKAWGYRNVSGSRYTWVGDVVTRVSGSDEFFSDVVGKKLSLHTTINQYHLRCVERISATQIRVNQQNTIGSTTYEHILRFGSCAVSTTLDSDKVYLDGAMPLDTGMVGLELCIPRAESNGSILFTRIVGVNPSTRELTLDQPCQATLNPVANPMTETVDIATPVFKITSDIKEGVYANGVSQVRIYNGQFESFDGVAIAIDDAELLDMFGMKIHGVQTLYTWTHHSVGAIWANRIGGQFQGSLDGSFYGQYRLIAGDNTHNWDIKHLSARMGTYENLIYISPFLSGYNGARITFDTVAFLRTLPGVHFKDLVYDAHYLATGKPGYAPPINMVLGDRQTSFRYLSDTSWVDTDGGFSLAGGRATFSPSNGWFTLRSTRVQEQGASFEIWDTDNGGTTRLKFTDNGGNDRGAIVHVTSTGVMRHTVGGVDQIAVTGRGLSLINARGPYADNAAAISSGLTVGDLYFDSDNIVRIVR